MLTSKINRSSFSGKPWYWLYKETAIGKVINGYEVRVFLPWTKSTPNIPRYARIIKGSSEMTTYLDSELIPVEETLLQYQSLTENRSWSYPYQVPEVKVSDAEVVSGYTVFIPDKVEPEQVKAPLYVETKSGGKRMDGWLGHELQIISESLRKLNLQKIENDIDELQDRQKDCCSKLNNKIDAVKADVDSINTTITSLQQTVNTLQSAQQTCCDGLNAKLDTILNILEEPPAPVPVSFDVTLTPA